MNYAETPRSRKSRDPGHPDFFGATQSLQAQPSANPKAAQTSANRCAPNFATRRPRCSLETVTTLCRLTAQTCFIPSSSVKTTSDGTPRTVEVMGATVTADK